MSWPRAIAIMTLSALAFFGLLYAVIALSNN
jgi:hypothetical protein